MPHDDLRRAIEALASPMRRDLEALIRIPSVSAAGFDPAAVQASADQTAALLDAAGCSGVRRLEVEGAHPAVFGEIPGPPGAPTVLLYAHHDVQPPGSLADWASDPFEPVEVDGRLFGRGSSDDKAGIVLHCAALAAHGDAVPVGVKVFVEGEEEIGSPHLGEFLERHGDALAADVIVIADSGNWRTGQPALTTSLRGLVDCFVEVRTLRYAVHSGKYGGVLPDALTCLARLLATLHDDEGAVAVPGLASGEGAPLELTEEELREASGAVPGVELIGRGSLTSRMWNRPAVSVLGIDAPAADGAVNALVPVARAKVSLRIAPGDDPPRAMNALRDHLLANAPWGAQVTVAPNSSGAPYALQADGPAFTAWREAFAAAWGRAPVDIGVGGSIPFVAAFAGRFPDAAILLVGAADDKSRAHGPNESVDLGDFRRAALGEAIAFRLLAG